MSGGARRAATAAERSRARRLRARADLSAPDRAWLEAYEAERRAYEAERRGAPPPPPPKAPPVEAPLEPERFEELAEQPETEPEEEVPIPERLFFEPEPESRPAEADADELEDESDHCPLGPDCPACSAATRTGARRCPRTDRLVWPPMSERQARAQASAILGVVGLAIKKGREWRSGKAAPFVLPSEEERSSMAEALAEIQRTHASWLAFGAEFTALGSALGRYAVRAATAPHSGGEA